MKNYNECPNEIEEIYQGEDLLIEGCIYDDNDEAMDIAGYTLVANFIAARKKRSTRLFESQIQAHSHLLYRETSPPQSKVCILLQ